MTGEAQAPQLERSPRSPQLGKNPCSNEVTAQPKANKYRTEFKKKKVKKARHRLNDVVSFMSCESWKRIFRRDTEGKRVEFIRV